MDFACRLIALLELLKLPFALLRCTAYCLQVRILRLSSLSNNFQERARGGGGEVWKYDRAENSINPLYDVGIAMLSINQNEAFSIGM